MTKRDGVEQKTNSPTSVIGPLSYASPATERQRAGFFARPIGWPFVIFALVLACVSIYAASGPDVYMRVVLVVMVGWFVAAIWWGIKGVFTVISYARKDSPAGCSVWKLLAAPVLAAGTLVVNTSGLPARAAFCVARPSMESIAKARLLAPDGSSLQRYVFPYGICVFTHDGNCITVNVVDAGMIDTIGYVYCPSGSPNAPGKTSVMGGSWYAWFEKF